MQRQWDALSCLTKCDITAPMPMQRIPPNDNSPHSRIFNLSQIESFPVIASYLRAAIRTDPILSKISKFMALLTSNMSSVHHTTNFEQVSYLSVNTSGVQPCKLTFQ